MPALGQTTDELTIVDWLRNVGDDVALGDRLLTVETDKASVDVESAFAGTLLSIEYPAGSTVTTGTVIAYIGARDEVAPSPREIFGQEPAFAKPVAATEVRPSGRRVLAAPAARRLAEERGVQLEDIRGTGPKGAVTMEDVLASIQGGPDRVAPILAVPKRRLALAERLSASAAVVPQFSLTLTADMSRSQAILERLRPRVPRLTYTHILLRSVAIAIRRHPALNAIWSSDGPQILKLQGVAVGLAVEADDNLVVAAVPEPDVFGWPQLVAAVEDLIGRARSARLTQSDLQPIAITLSNLGMYGIEEFVALVSPGQTATLAVGRVLPRNVVIGGEVAIRPTAKLTLSVDHRVIDGAPAARFLASIKELLEAPIEEENATRPLE